MGVTIMRYVAYACDDCDATARSEPTRPSLAEVDPPDGWTVTLTRAWCPVHGPAMGEYLRDCRAWRRDMEAAQEAAYRLEAAAMNQWREDNPSPVLSTEATS